MRDRAQRLRRIQRPVQFGRRGDQEFHAPTLLPQAVERGVHDHRGEQRQHDPHARDRSEHRRDMCFVGERREERDQRRDRDDDEARAGLKRRRVTERTSIRLATLLHAIRSTNPTVPSSTSSVHSPY